MDLLGACVQWIINTVPLGSLYMFPNDCGWWAGMAAWSERNWTDQALAELDPYVARLISYQVP